jgi:hypothetical protein
MRIRLAPFNRGWGVVKNLCTREETNRQWGRLQAIGALLICMVLSW